MAKEWILNSAMNRFQLNFKRNVGAVAEAVRKCAPKNVEEWEAYYFANVNSREHIVDLGKRLYVKVTEVIAHEVESVTEQDCIDYMVQMVIGRTFDGYIREINTVYGQLQSLLGMSIQPAPDIWDRKYNVDFFIEVSKDAFVGLQIKPVNSVTHIPQVYKERTLQRKSHEKFTQEYKGQVFYVFSVSKEGKKEIINRDVLEEIQMEVKRLQDVSSF